MRAGGDVMPGTTGRGTPTPGAQSAASGTSALPSSTPESMASTAPVAPQGSTNRAPRY